MSGRIESKVEQYYSEKVREHGATSQGVDWNGKASHFLRFEQLTKLIGDDEHFSLLDYGCGFGSLIEFLNSSKYSFDYTGFDISEEMIKKGKELHTKSNLQFFSNAEALKMSDYVIANGIFNVKLKEEEEVWKKYIYDTVLKMSGLARKGLSFNILTSYSDEEYKKDYLYYANPLEVFDFCKKNISKNVALLHDYELYEFTIIIRK